MTKPYDLLQGVLNEIEKNLKGSVSDSSLAEKFSLSKGYLRRLFKFAFGQTLGTYIRSRKLAASIDDLLNTNNKILNIALDYELDYEQSYIRTFKREFGITPGDLRKSGQIVKITPPLHLFDSNKLGDKLIFGPDIVIVPQFFTVGKKYKTPYHKILTMDMPVAKQFFYNERQNIPNTINPDTIISICIGTPGGEDYIYLMPSVQVKSHDNIPKGYEPYTFSTSLCARFRFILNNFDEVNMHTADDMFQAIDNFNASEEQNYFIYRGLNIDIFNLPKKNDDYCQWEWLAPVIEKTSWDIAPFNPSGIKKFYKQELPALRFIGKKCIETTGTANIINLLDNWQLNNMFDDIEKQSDIDLKTLYQGGNAYINLVRKRDGGISEHWMGMFLPKGAKVPQGYEAIDFPKSKLAVCGVYGKRDEVACYETECRNKLAEEGYTHESRCHFRRFNWRDFFALDAYGKRWLEYCYYI